MRRLWLLLAGIGLIGAPVTAQEVEEDDSVFERGCGDDRGTDRCSDEVQAKMRALYGLESAEELGKSRTSVYRAMFVDGYGNDMVAISFVREPGRSPYVDARSPGIKPEEAQPLQANISEELWTRIQELSENFDQALAKDNADTGTIKLCLHGWFVVAETVQVRAPIRSTVSSKDGDGNRTEETVIRELEPTIRRDAEGACADGLANPYAFQLAYEASRVLAECSGLDLDDFRNIPQLLATCHRLKGDRLAAARAYSLVEAVNRYRWRKDPREFSAHFAYGDEDEQAAFIAMLDAAVLYFDMPEAVSPYEAVMRGALYYYPEEEEADLPSEQATLQISLEGSGNSFEIRSWAVSPREPFRQEETMVSVSGVD